MKNQKHVCASNNVLIHIGFHKTASTWFQKELFSNSEIGFHLCKHNRNSIHRAFCQPFHARAPQISLVESIVDEANTTTARGGVFVLSHERLSGYPASGGFDSEVIANRLKIHFPNASVLCVFREQVSMILSAWRQQVVDGGGLSLAQFLNPPEPHITRMPLFSLEMYKYSRLYKHYTELFLEDEVSFIPYEKFCIETRGVVSSIIRQAGLDVAQDKTDALVGLKSEHNPSISLSVLTMQRIMNLLFTRNQLTQNCLLNLGSRNIRILFNQVSTLGAGMLLSPLDRVLLVKAQNQIKQAVLNEFSDDNSQLSMLLNIELSKLGYNCST